MILIIIAYCLFCYCVLIGANNKERWLASDYLLFVLAPLAVPFALGIHTGRGLRLRWIESERKRLKTLRK